MSLSRREFIASTGAALFTPSILRAQSVIEDNFATYDPIQIAQSQGIDIFTRPVRYAGIQLKCLMDISRSMSNKEYKIQKTGTAIALKSQQVKSAIQQQGSVIFSVTEFCAITTHRIPWAILQNDEDVEFMAHIIETMPTNPFRRGTGLQQALESCRRDFSKVSTPVQRRILDISGDGGDNQASSHSNVAADLVRVSAHNCARDAITCNGITLPTDNNSRLPTGISSIGQYYRHYVRTPENFTYPNQYGGTDRTPAGFVIEVNEWEGFEEAMSEKLRLEILGALPANPKIRFG